MLREDFVDTVMTTARVANEEVSRATDAAVLCFAAQSEIDKVKCRFAAFNGWITEKG